MHGLKKLFIFQALLNDLFYKNFVKINYYTWGEYSNSASFSLYLSLVDFWIIKLPGCNRLRIVGENHEALFSTSSSEYLRSSRRYSSTRVVCDVALHWPIQINGSSNMFDICFFHWTRLFIHWINFRLVSRWQIIISSGCI